MKSGLSIDTRQFSRAMREYHRATKKDEAEVLNRAGRNVSMLASQFTPKAVSSRIKSALLANNLAVRILASRGRFKGATMAERSAITEKFINARVRSARYIAAGWSKAIKTFGGKGMQVNPRSEAAKGYGKKASANSLIAEIANNSRGAEKVALKALQDAINFVARDMATHAQKVMQRTASKFSAKGLK